MHPDSWKFRIISLQVEHVHLQHKIRYLREIPVTPPELSLSKLLPQVLQLSSGKFSENSVQEHGM